MSERLESLYSHEARSFPPLIVGANQALSPISQIEQKFISLNTAHQRKKIETHTVMSAEDRHCSSEDLHADLKFLGGRPTSYPARQSRQGSKGHRQNTHHPTVRAHGQNRKKHLTERKKVGANLCPIVEAVLVDES